MPQFEHPLYFTARRWWIFLLFGGVFLVAGIWVFLNAQDELFRIDTILRYVVLGLGVAQWIASILFQKDAPEKWWNRIVGSLEVVLGIYLIVAPGRSVFFVAILVAIWLLLRGIFLIGYAFQFRKIDHQQWFWTLIGGGIMVLLTYFIVRNPLEEDVSALFWIALNMVLGGFFHVLLSFKFRSINQNQRKEERLARKAVAGNRPEENGIG